MKKSSVTKKSLSLPRNMPLTEVLTASPAPPTPIQVHDEN